MSKCDCHQKYGPTKWLERTKKEPTEEELRKALEGKMSRIDEIRERFGRDDNHGRKDDCDMCGCMLTYAEEKYLLDRVEKLEEQLTKAWYLIDHKNHTEYDEMVDEWRKEKETLKEE